MGLIAQKSFWLIIGVYLPVLAVYVALLQNVAPYLASLGFSTRIAGSLLAVFSASGAAATLSLGMLSDRFGNRLPYAGLALCVAIGAIFLTFNAGLPVIFLGCVLIGAGGGQFVLLTATAADQFGAENIGRTFGLCMLFLPLAQIGPYSLARTREVQGSYTPALIGLAVATSVGSRNYSSLERPLEGLGFESHC